MSPRCSADGVVCAVSKQRLPKFKMDEEAVGATDNIVTEFATYEDFLDSQITPLDLFYLEVMFIFISICCWLELTVHLRPSNGLVFLFLLSASFCCCCRFNLAVNHDKQYYMIEI